jgi:hypothetical protein
MARGTHQDLSACFAWKQIGLGFSSLARRLVEVGRRWCTCHHHGGCVEVKQKTVDSMASGAVQCRSDQTTIILS